MGMCEGRWRETVEDSKSVINGGKRVWVGRSGGEEETGVGVGMR